MKITRTLYVHRRSAWRAWLKKHHQTAREIWLVYYKKDSGRPRISYNDAINEAICFGWIDSTAKPLNDKSYCQRFSPRRKGSPISELNKARARRLIREGRMAPAGLTSLKDALRQGAVFHKGKIRETRAWREAPDILKALKADPEAWRHYRKFPQTYRRIRTAWIEGARHRPSVFRTRLGYFVRMTSQNKRFGMLRG